MGESGGFSIIFRILSARGKDMVTVECQAWTGRARLGSFAMSCQS